jgi:hypothetical protein
VLFTERHGRPVREGMASWSEVQGAAPDLAGFVQGRFEAYGLGLLATLRRDGSPRISGIEPLFAEGELWLGMMPGSRKAADLMRDPRFALHNATVDKQVERGDAKIAGHARPVESGDALERFRRAFERHTGSPPPPGPFSLFLADVQEVSIVRPGGDHLDIEWWREGGRVQRVERR